MSSERVAVYPGTFDPVIHIGRDEARDIATQLGDFLYETRRNELLALGSHQEHCLDFLVETSVH